MPTREAKNTDAELEGIQLLRESQEPLALVQTALWEKNGDAAKTLLHRLRRKKG